MKKTYLYISLLLMVAVMPACRKYIYEKPINSSYDDIFWVNQKNADQATAGAYHLLREAVKNGNSYFTFADVAADLMENREWNYTQFLRDPGNFRFGYAPYLEGELWDWSKFYDAIAQCNLILEKLPAIPESGFTDAAVRDRLTGEAHFIRAYAYFYILRVWGEPVLVTKTIKEDELDNTPNYARSTDADAIKLIREDLVKAIELLPETSDEQPVRANKFAAYALQTHVSAWDQQWDEAVQAADKVISSGQYELFMDTTKMQSIWTGETNEPVFEFATRYSDVFDETGVYGFFGGLLREVEGAPAEGGFVVNTSRMLGIVNEFNTNDRFYAGKKPLFTPQDARWNRCFIRETKGAMLVKYANIAYRDAKNKVNPYVDNNLVMIRLADIILLKAEALANLGRNGEAITALNEIRERAGVPDYNAATDGDLKYFIIDERQRELLGEGNAFYDLIRSRQLETRLPVYAGERWQQKGFYWPLNLRTLKPANDKLTQNYYWATH